MIRVDLKSIFKDNYVFRIEWLETVYNENGVFPTWHMFETPSAQDFAQVTPQKIQVKVWYG